MSEVTKSTICGYCSTGCSIDIAVDGDEVLTQRGKKTYPVNVGKACPKGLNLVAPYQHKERGIAPLLKDADGKQQAVSWDKATAEFCTRVKDVQHKYGNESVAFISTGQIPMEEMAFLGALSKFGMGMVHGDGNTRQCMATSVVAYKQSFGFDAPPYTYKDFEESDVLVFIGANPVVAHPIMWTRVRNNKKSPKIIVLDPRQTKTAKVATNHYALNSKSDITLFYGLANYFIQNKWIDKSFIETSTNGYEDFAEHVSHCTVDHVTESTGLSEEQFLELAQMIHEGKNVSFWWTMGVNQSHQGVKTAQSIINFAMMTGNIGRPGTGANSITGQCNAMGSRLFSNTTSLFAGYDFANAEHRQKMADLLNIDESLIPQRPSLPYDKILEGVKEGTIKGLWIIATNPAHSWIGRNELIKTLGNLEFLVVQDLYPNTETAKLADLYLPAAGSCEKEGTFINSERRLAHVRKIINPPGDAKTDFDIFKLLAREWGCEKLFEEWQTPEQVFKILRRTSAGQPCDITGISGYDMLDENGGVQWPFPAGSTLESNERRLFENGMFYTPSGKANFKYEAPRKPAEIPDADHPFLLNTGRGTVSQWHTETRTGKIAKLAKASPKVLQVEVNPDDALIKNIHTGDVVWVVGRRGSVRCEAVVAKTVKPGELFMPMHYLHTNDLTFPEFDPESREPAYKNAAVSLIRETLYLELFNPKPF